MTTTRRGFLGAMLAACAAPAIVKAESLMKIVVPSTEIVVPDYYALGRQGGKTTLASMEIGRIDGFRVWEEVSENPAIHKKLSDLMAEHLYRAANREGFVRRYTDRMQVRELDNINVAELVRSIKTSVDEESSRKMFFKMMGASGYRS